VRIFTLKIESLRNVATSLNITAKLVVSKCYQNKYKIGELIGYVISQLIFFGGREIAQAGSKILPKVLQNFG